MGLTYSLGPAYLLGFLNLYFYNVSLQFLLFFLISSKALSNLNIEEDFWKEEEETGEEKGGLLFRDLDCRGKMFTNF
jgi:hypothetical protein